jgi:CarboxypepD_reg-like domain
MNDKEKNKPVFSTAILQQYAEGHLTDEERHAIEEAALEDPFLAAAIEGIEMQLVAGGQSSFVSDVASLRKKIQDRITASRKIAWWQVAASVILLLGSVSFMYIYLSGRGKQPSNIAVKRSIPAENRGSAAPSETASPGDSTAVARHPVIPATVKKNREKLPAYVDKFQKSTGDSSMLVVTREDIVSKPAIVSAGDSIDLSIASRPPVTIDQELEGRAAGVNIQARKKAPSFYVQGIVTDTGNRPVAGATVRLKNKGNAAVTDRDGRFQLSGSGKDTTVNIEVQAIGYQSAIASLSSRESSGNRVQLRPMVTSLNDVVVIGYGAAKKDDDGEDLSAAPSGQKNKEPKINPRVVPSNGWPAYQVYLDQHKKIAGSDSTLHGNEVISFLVNRAGTYSSFRIEQSLSPAHDQEAIRLVREGPSWKLLNGNRQRCRLVIPF